MKRKLITMIAAVFLFSNTIGEQRTEQIISTVLSNAGEFVKKNVSQIIEDAKSSIDIDIEDINLNKFIQTKEITLKRSKETSSDLEIHYIDVGQGDATLVVHGEHAMLIDAGENDKGTAVQQYIAKKGVGDELVLDYVIGTHADSDHVGGLDVIITKFDCGTILLPNTDKDSVTYKDVLNAVKYKAYNPIMPEAGQTYSFGEDASFTIIAPNEYYEEENNRSIGIMLQHGDNRFLFMGDAEKESEEATINAGWNIQADVYKVNHHGSKSSSTEKLLEKISPEYAVISCGLDNEYGHPHAETLNNLRAGNIKVFRTDEQGSIIAYSDGNNVKWNVPESVSWKAGD